MKKLLIGSAIVAFGLFIGTNYYYLVQGTDTQTEQASVANALPKRILLVSPAGGEVPSKATPVTIKWATNNIGSDMVQISLYNNGVFMHTITGAIPNVGTFRWLIDPSVPTGTNYTIKVINADDLSIESAPSGSFEIVEGSI